MADLLGKIEITYLCFTINNLPSLSMSILSIIKGYTESTHYLLKQNTRLTHAHSALESSLEIIRIENASLRGQVEKLTEELTDKNNQLESCQDIADYDYQKSEIKHEENYELDQNMKYIAKVCELENQIERMQRATTNFQWFYRRIIAKHKVVGGKVIINCDTESVLKKVLNTNERRKVYEEYTTGIDSFIETNSDCFKIFIEFTFQFETESDCVLIELLDDIANA